MAQILNQVPPGAEVWYVGQGGAVYLVWMNDRIQPPIPMMWHVQNMDDFAALGANVKYDRQFATEADLYRTGALRFGTTRELVNTTVDPRESVYSNYQTEVRVKPWLADPEVLTLWMQAALEGRSISDAELQGTNWWRTHTETERQWISLNASDPATANQLISDQRNRVATMLREAGVDNASPQLAQLIADKWTQGAWSESYAVSQIRLLSDPYAGGTLDAALTSFRPGLDTTSEGVEDVRGMVNQWVGPAYASRYSQEFLDGWAGKLRNTPDAREELIAVLRSQRQALFPEYENSNLTYEDIAGPWRGVFTQEWGQTADESDPLFGRIVRMNDLAGATQLLRREGLKRGNQTVGQRMLTSLNDAFGGQVRRADPAIV